MPYISMDDRRVFGKILLELDALVCQRGLSNGELNYLMTQLGLLYLKRHGTSYNTISDVVKAMECAKLEFYARVARPYEQEKCQINGDVY